MNLLVLRKYNYILDSECRGECVKFKFIFWIQNLVKNLLALACFFNAFFPNETTSIFSIMFQSLHSFPQFLVALVVCKVFWEVSKENVQNSTLLPKSRATYILLRCTSFRKKINDENFFKNLEFYIYLKYNKNRV